MTHYDEFNVSPSATPEEIRQAHRNMARLLHPDNFQDGNLRALAECQMKRVNRIYSVLSDPAQRLAYDQEISLAAHRAREPKRKAFSGQRIAPWLVAAAGLSFGLAPYLRDPVAVSGMAASATAAAGAAREPETDKPGEVASAGRTERVARSRRSGLPEPRGGVEQPAAMPSSLPGVRVPDPDPANQPSASAAAPAKTDSESAALPATHAAEQSGSEEPPRLQVDGTWLYVAPARKEAEDLYPPEYIELSISSDREAMWGRYRARYKVADRAISPEVDFRFEAILPAPERISWSGNGGAKGELRLTLLSANRLSVEWFTKSFGQQLTLGSGTAVLIRRD
jgi:curved DNA-binding protein CbpA